MKAHVRPAEQSEIRSVEDFQRVYVVDEVVEIGALRANILGKIDSKPGIPNFLERGRPQVPAPCGRVPKVLDDAVFAVRIRKTLAGETADVVLKQVSVVAPHGNVACKPRFLLRTVDRGNAVPS